VAWFRQHPEKIQAGSAAKMLLRKKKRGEGEYVAI
jgi:hypothetical protein